MIFYFIFFYFFSNLFSDPICTNPLLNQKANLWAPDPMSIPSILMNYDSLPICSKIYLKNDICCTIDILKDYIVKFYIFKDILQTESQKQNLMFASKVEYFFANRKSIIQLFIDTNVTSTLMKEGIKKLNFSNINIPEGINSKDLPGFLNEFQDFLQNNENVINETLKSIKERTQIDQNLSSALGLNNDFYDNLTSMNSDDLDYEINNTQTRYLKLMKSKTRCYSALFRHFASLFCISCTPDYENNGFALRNGKVNLRLNRLSCEFFKNDCLEYIDNLYEMNKNSMLFSYIETLQELKLNSYDANDAASLRSYVFDRSRLMATSLNKQQLFQKLSNCNINLCDWICFNYITSNGLNFKQILNGTVSKNIINPLTYSRRILEENNIDYNYQSMFESYRYGELTELDYFVDGNAGVQLFAKPDEIIFTNNGNLIAIKIMFLLILILFAFFA